MSIVPSDTDASEVVIIHSEMSCQSAVSAACPEALSRILGVFLAIVVPLSAIRSLQTRVEMLPAGSSSLDPDVEDAK